MDDLEELDDAEVILDGFGSNGLVLDEFDDLDLEEDGVDVELISSVTLTRLSEVGWTVTTLGNVIVVAFNNFDEQLYESDKFDGDELRFSC